MATPGPAQRFPANIVRISFPQIGGLVYLRAQIRSSSDVSPITPTTVLKGLPWGDIDLFDVVGGVVDPQASEALQAEDVPIVDPVSDKMLAKYLYWAHRAAVKNRRTTIIPGIDVYVVDTANWTKIYNHVATFQLSPVWTRQQAIDYFTTPPGLLPGQDPSLVGVAITDNFGNLVPIPSTLFFQMAAEAGWTYHTEPGGSTSIYEEDDVASVIINTGKLFRDVPSLPGGSKPVDIDFTIDEPIFTHGPGHGNIEWWLSGSGWVPKDRDPDDPAGEFSNNRRTFPVTDQVVPVSGIPGAFTTDYNWPTFPHPFNVDTAAIENLSITSTLRTDDGAITFGAATVPPLIELFPGAGGGGEG